MSNFLPDKYKVPSTKGYMKLKDGKNKFRVLSSAIVGYEYWDKDNKPVRSKTPVLTIPEDIRYEKDGFPSKIKHFWAFVVWNYGDSAVQVLEVVQSTIQEQIKNYVDQEEWGDPKEYDLVITRSGDGFDTTYLVTANPKTEVTKEIEEAYALKKVNLDALYKGENPFKSGRLDEE